jgi:iron-sulfur cluster repair protein YtfE (RIC family)
MAKAKATAEKLQKIYGDKPEVAAKVQKFFATL